MNGESCFSPDDTDCSNPYDIDCFYGTCATIVSTAEVKPNTWWIKDDNGDIPCFVCCNHPDCPSHPQDFMNNWRTDSCLKIEEKEF